MDAKYSRFDLGKSHKTFCGLYFGQRPHGNRPPEDIERRPLRDFALSNDKEKIEKQRKKREKKLKKILTDKQYVRWVEKQHPVIPEDREKGKRKEQ